MLSHEELLHYAKKSLNATHLYTNGIRTSEYVNLEIIIYKRIFQGVEGIFCDVKFAEEYFVLNIDSIQELLDSTETQVHLMVRCKELPENFPSLIFHYLKITDEYYNLTLGLLHKCHYKKLIIESFIERELIFDIVPYYIIDLAMKKHTTIVWQLTYGIKRLSLFDTAKKLEPFNGYIQKIDLNTFYVNVVFDESFQEKNLLS